MHELGIVYHIFAMSENVARANGVRRVSSVTAGCWARSRASFDLLLDAWRWGGR